MKDLVVKTNLVSIWDLGELDEPNENGMMVRKVPNRTPTGPEAFILSLQTYKGTDILSQGPKRNMSASISMTIPLMKEILEYMELCVQDQNGGK
jgi:hypothetical protein